MFALVLRFIEDRDHHPIYGICLVGLYAISMALVQANRPVDYERLKIEADVQKSAHAVELEKIKQGLINCKYYIPDVGSETVSTTRDHCSYLHELSLVGREKIKEPFPQWREKPINNSGESNGTTTVNLQQP